MPFDESPRHMREFKNRPSFFVIGAQKAGTTRLCHLLDRHPDVVIPTKEPFYFQSIEAMHDKRDWYRSLFENSGSGLIFGEGSTYYSMCDKFPGTAARIHDFNPDSRIIYMVRHPLRRIESAWYQLLSTRELSGIQSFSDAVRRSDDLIEPTLYWKQLSPYRDYFRDEQIHVAVFEEFVQDELQIVRACLQFLGIENTSFTEVESDDGKNASAAKQQPWLLVDTIKALPGYSRVKRVIPEQLRASLGERLLKPITAVPRWDVDAFAVCA